MRGFLITVTVLAGMTVVTAPALAEGKAFSVGVGSLGIGIDGAFAVNDAVAIRANANWGRYEVPDFMVVAGAFEGINLNYDAEMLSVGLIADLYLGGGAPGRGFAVSAGLYYNGNKFVYNDLFTVGTTIGSTPYTPAEIGILNAEVDFRPVAPYLGIGYENIFFEEIVGGTRYVEAIPIAYFVRLGILFQGRPSVTLTSTGTVTAADLAIEARELEDDFAYFKAYPVLSAGVSVRF